MDPSPIILITVGVVGGSIGAYNLGTYLGRVGVLVNEAIKGREPLTESKEPAYKSRIDKMFDFLDFGSKLADKRYKAGKFDELIASYKA
jgi:hypothetical protein